MDLSKVLGDVYDSDGPDAAAPPAQASAPQWSDEAHLDEVFASWTPGPPASAPAAEREMLESLSDKEPVQDAVAAALSAALVGQDPSVGSMSALDPLPVDLAPLAPLAPMQPATPPSWYAELQDLKPVTPEAGDDADAGLVGSHPAPVRSWTRHDDDILPSGAKGEKAPKVKAEKAPKVKAGRGRHAKGQSEAAANPAAEISGDLNVAVAAADPAPKAKRAFSLRRR